MIKAVFFDWYSTLADIDGPRAERYIGMFRELGIEIPPDAAVRGILRADAYLTAEEQRRPLALRTREERAEMYVIYPRLILEEAGLTGRDEDAEKVKDMMRDLRRETRMVATLALFEDVRPAIAALKARGLILGVISNASRELSRACDDLKLTSYLDLILTSQEAGASKPDPVIFRTALARLNVPAEAAVFVGDQYEADVVGARGAGIRGILIDRYNLHADKTDCPRIRSLAELGSCLEE